MDTQKILIGTLAGLIAGVALGLLLAPASGTETRRLIVDSAGRLKKRFHKNGEGEFSDSEMEMDALSGNRFGPGGSAS